MSKSERVAPCHCCCFCCSLCGCLTAFNLGHYNSRHFQWHLNAALCATRLDSTRILNSHRRRQQLPDWDNDKPNMILRQCYYVQRGDGEKGRTCCCRMNPLYVAPCCCVCSDVNGSRVGGWGVESRLAPGLQGLTLTLPL